MVIFYFVLIQCELNEKQKKELECQLHAADYSKLNEITAGLLVSANHLVCIVLSKFIRVRNTALQFRRDANW